MVAALLFALFAAADPALAAARADDSVCYAATVGELLALQKDPAAVAARARLTSLGGDRFGLQHLLLGALRVKLEQGEGALLDPDMRRFADGPGFLDTVSYGMASVHPLVVCVRVPKGVRPRGELWLPVDVPEGEPALARRRLDRFPFEFPADAAPVEPARFDEALQQQAARLALLDVPGHPLFDARARGLAAYDAQIARNLPGGVAREGVAREDDLTRTFELFTGGRALQENLQVDRMRNVAAKGDATVAVASIEGITIDPVDWKKRLTGPEPQLETLAGWVPADQIYVAFPTFGALTRLLDEMEKRGDTLVHLLEPRGEDARTRERLETQIGLSTSFAARLLGPALVKSVAFTASDPYLREGTDVALLLDCVATPPIEQHLAERRAAAAKQVAGCVADESDHAGVHVHGLVSPDRRVSTWSATVGNVVLVSNSKAQLERLIDAHGATSGASAKVLSASDEFRFFRMRYPLAPERDAALIVLSDPFLRRFCGPAWRIAESRRLRCAAVLSRLDGLRANGAKEDAAALARREGLACPTDPAATFTFGAGGAGGARCSVHGGAGFLTPIAETPVLQATVAERDAYLLFRNRYQEYWRQYFDPIAIEVSPAEPLSVDVTVLPLIAHSAYSDFREITCGNGEIPDHAGDPHPDSVWHSIVHLNREAPPVKEIADFLTSSLPDSPIKGIGWLGDTIELYLDDSPLLDTLKRSRNPSVDFEQNLSHLPFAARVAIRDPLAFALFLTAGRALIESSLPGATVWETRKHGDLSYVVVRGKPDAGVPMGGLEKLQLCYATISGGFCVSLDEEVLKRALDRGAARNAAATKGDAPPATGAPAAVPAPAWLGRHVAVTIDVQRALAVLLPLSEQIGDPAEEDAALCLANLPVLDAWHARDPAVDPVQQHADLFGVTLVCPAGGTYAWDAALGAVTCSKHGHPLHPQRVEFAAAAISDLRRLSAGITFEEQGVRVRLEAERMR